jgi:hypothetical protein
MIISRWSQMGNAPTLFKSRTFLNTIVSKKIRRAGGTACHIVSIVPLRAHPNLTAADEGSAIRAEVVRAFRLSLVEPNVTKLEYCTQLDVKGSVPKWLVDVFVIPRLMSWVGEIRRYFQQIRPLRDCIVDDGKFIGKMLIALVQENLSHSFFGRLKLRFLVQEFILKTAMFRDAGIDRIDAFLFAVLAVIHSPQDLSTDPGAAPMAEIGLDLDSFLPLHHHGAAVLVGSFVNKHLRLRNADRRHVWFSPMLREIVAWRVKSGSFGSKLRFASLRYGQKLSAGVRNASSIITARRKSSNSVVPLGMEVPAPRKLIDAAASKRKLDFIAVVVSQPLAVARVEV